MYWVLHTVAKRQCTPRGLCYFGIPFSWTQDFFYPIRLKRWSWKWKNTCVSECKQSVILCDLWVLGGMFLLCKTSSVMCGVWLHPGSIACPKWVWTFSTGHNQCRQTTVSASFIWIHPAKRRMCDRVTQSKSQDKPILCEPHHKYNPENVLWDSGSFW